MFWRCEGLAFHTCHGLKFSGVFHQRVRFVARQENATGSSRGKCGGSTGKCSGWCVCTSSTTSSANAIWLIDFV